MYYYAISDIHGYLDELKESMKLVDLNDNNKLIFLGDYIDYGDYSRETLYYIKDLFDRYKNQIMVLRGNHEESFLEWLVSPIDNINYFTEDKELHTLKTFLDDMDIIHLSDNIEKRNVEVANIINNKHKDLINWLKSLPYYYETDKQIFVHAGIDEDAKELWKLGTPKYYFTDKYPDSLNNFKPFYKDVVAGHIGTTNFRIDKNNHNVFYDGLNHYYIDGTVNISHSIPILKFNTNTGKYTSFYKDNDSWKENNI